jgi:hypothetical protein
MTKWIDLLARLCKMSSEAFELGTTFQMLPPFPAFEFPANREKYRNSSFVTNEFCAPLLKPVTFRGS